MDPTGLALLIQQNTQQSADLAALRVDVAKMTPQLAAIPDIEQRLRMIEQRPSTADIEPRVSLLERWRYSLPASLVVSIGSAVAAVVAVVYH
jgi:hypothetical protein